MKKITILFLLIPIFTFSQEDFDWKYIGDTKDGSEVYVKIESIDSYSKEAWVKMTNPIVSKKTKSGKVVKSGGGYTLSYWEVDCGDKKISVSNRMAYSSRGNVIAQGEKYNDLSNERVIPDTVGEAIFKYICSYSSE